MRGSPRKSGLQPASPPRSASIERSLQQPRAARTRPVRGRDRREGLQRGRDLVGIEAAIAEPGLGRRGGAEGAAVDQRAHRLRRHPAAGGDLRDQLFEEVVDQRVELLALLRRHALAREVLGGGLVAADPNHLGLDVELVEQPAQIEAVEPQPDQEELADGRQPEPGGGARDQVFLRVEALRPDRDGLARRAQGQRPPAAARAPSRSRAARPRSAAARRRSGDRAAARSSASSSSSSVREASAAKGSRGGAGSSSGWARRTSSQAPVRRGSAARATRRRAARARFAPARPATRIGRRHQARRFRRPSR